MSSVNALAAEQDILLQRTLQNYIKERSVSKIGMICCDVVAHCAKSADDSAVAQLPIIYFACDRSDMNHFFLICQRSEDISAVLVFFAGGDSVFKNTEIIESGFEIQAQILHRS